MKTNKIILLLCTLFITFSCTYKDIDISADVKPFLVLDGHLTPDSLVKVRLSKSHFAYKYQSAKNLAIKDAVVKLYVNDKFVQKMQSVGDEGIYVANYKPKVDENIKITAERKGFESIEATTIIPKAPIFHLKDTTETYYEGEKTWREGFGPVNKDTLSRELDKKIKAHFQLTDLPDEHYYFHRVFTTSYTLIRNKQTQIMDTVWKSMEHSKSYNLKDVIPNVHPDGNIDDFLTFDEGDDKNSIFKGVTIFSDKMVDETKIDMFFTFDYVVAIRRYVDDKFIDERPYSDKKQDKQEIRLSSMSKDLYLFIKSLQEVKDIDNSPFIEPVQVHSNVKNGAGILGSYNTTTHIIKTVNR